MPRCVQHALVVVATAARDERPDVSAQAVDVLQRSLHLPALRAMGGGGWESVLTAVLFPLVVDVAAAPDVELVQRAFSMCTKSFLQYVSSCLAFSSICLMPIPLSPCSSLSSLASVGAVPRTWRQMLATAASCLRAARSELLREAVTEALKNMMLVLGAAQALPADAWVETWAAVDAASPALRAELYPMLGALRVWWLAAGVADWVDTQLRLCPVSRRRARRPRLLLLLWRLLALPPVHRPAQWPSQSQWSTDLQEHTLRPPRCLWPQSRRRLQHRL
jgi:hypothetical protein